MACHHSSAAEEYKQYGQKTDSSTENGKECH